LLKDEHLHNVPVGRMGNYHEYLSKATQPLRKIDTTPERVHTFGNPFKVNKVSPRKSLIFAINFI